MNGGSSTLLKQAAEALEAKEYAKAEALQRQACEFLRTRQAPNAELANELEKLADLHCIQHKFDICASEYAEVVQLRRTFLPANDFNILRPLYGLAKSQFEAQRYDEAEAEMRAALGIAETHPEFPQSIVFCLYELGWMLYYTGKHREAEPYLSKALPMSEAAYGESHDQTIRILGAIALLYGNSDLGKDPEPFFRRVIDATKGNERNEHTYLCNLCRLTGYLAERKEFVRADELFADLLSFINDRNLVSKADYHWIVHNCADYFQSRGRTDLATQLHTISDPHDAYAEIVQQKLAHAEQTLSDDDPQFAQALLQAGNNATFEGNYEEAESLLDRGLDACMRAYGETHSETLFALGRVCIIKRILKKFDEAEVAIQQAIRGAKQHSSNDRLCPWILENLALLREAEGRTEDAVRVFEEVIKESEKVHGFPSEGTVEHLFHQSGCLLRMDQVALAEQAIRRAIGVLDQVDSLHDCEKSDYFATLALILEATERKPEAAEMQARADELLSRADSEFEG